MDIMPIAYIKNDFSNKFAVPRQSNIANQIKSLIVFEKDFSRPEAVKGINGFDYLWLIWGFSLNKHPINSLTVRPPRLGGNKRVGVFATRSPYRPNPIGLSSVKLLEVITDNAGTKLVVSGADLADGTPIYDIKPYVPYSDCHTDAAGGFTDDVPFKKLRVVCECNARDYLNEEQYDNLVAILENDPRPAYQIGSEREYGFCFAKCEIKFHVEKDTLKITDIKN